MVEREGIPRTHDLTQRYTRLCHVVLHMPWIPSQDVGPVRPIYCVTRPPAVSRHYLDIKVKEHTGDIVWRHMIERRGYNYIMNVRPTEHTVRYITAFSSSDLRCLQCNVSVALALPTVVMLRSSVVP